MIGQRSLPVLLLSDWYALLDAALVLAAGALWYAMPELGPWPLVLALAAWPLRIAVGRLPFRRTPFDLLFLIFLATALVGVWAAYDRERALAKFWLILDGVLLFYALAAQPRSNLIRIAWAMGGLASLVCIYYFLAHDWVAAPAKVDALNRIGLAWMDLRPALQLRALHPNVVAGIAGMLAPFLIAAGLSERRAGRAGGAAIAAVVLVFVLFTLLMTTSRGAWLAISAALGLWFLWWVSGQFARYGQQSQSVIFLAFTGFLAVLAVILVATTPGGLVALFEQLPGPSHTGSRLDLMRASAYLISDFPITGGGLDAFSGLYGQYILVSPFYIVEHGHNLFLDVTLEQGILGGMALVAILGIAIFQLGRSAREEGASPVLLAALAGMVFMAVHGLLDDTLYGSRAQLLLWAAPGIGFAHLSRPVRQKETGAVDTRVLVTAGVAVVVFLIYGFVFRDTLRIVWWANLGAVEMARTELADFPTGKWADGSRAGDLTEAAVIFEGVIREHPGNQTARFRLGAIGLLTRKFDVAVEHLEAAFRSSPNHPGIRKSLAYAYVWTGRVGEAIALMSGLDDVGTEIRNYAGWWRSQGREDLAIKAEAILALLEPGR